MTKMYRIHNFHSLATVRVARDNKIIFLLGMSQQSINFCCMFRLDIRRGAVCHILTSALSDGNG